MGQCRAYEPADRAACIELLRRGHDPRFSEERFAWLHELGPGGPSCKVVVEAEGRIVGLYAVLPRPAHLDGRLITAGRDVDPVVDPDWRGKGLFTRMLDWMLASDSGVDVFYNFANPASAPGFRKRGWQEADRLADHVAQLGYRTLLGREGLLWAASRLARPPLGELPVRELSIDEVAGLSDPLPPPGRRFVVQRSAAYLAWRYGQSPLREYHSLARHDGDELVDMLVVRADPDVRRITLVDLSVYRADGGTFAAYLPYLAEQFGGCWVGVWSTVSASWRRGFVRSPRARGMPLLVRSDSGRDDLGRALGPGDCFVSHGDLEAN